MGLLSMEVTAAAAAALEELIEDVRGRSSSDTISVLGFGLCNQYGALLLIYILAMVTIRVGSDPTITEIQVGRLLYNSIQNPTVQVH